MSSAKWWVFCCGLTGLTATSCTLMPFPCPCNEPIVCPSVPPDFQLHRHCATVSWEPDYHRYIAGSRWPIDGMVRATVYPKKYAHNFCFDVLCCGYTLTDFPISIRLTSLALWQSNDCPSASKATLMNMDKYFIWIHYERLYNHNKAKHNKTVCIFLGIYCIGRALPFLSTALHQYHFFCIIAKYRKISNIRRTLLGNKIVDHSDVVGASPVILDSTSGFKGFCEDSCKTVRESFKCWDLVRLILETWRYL